MLFCTSVVLVTLMLSLNSWSNALSTSLLTSNSCGSCERSINFHDGGWWVSHSPTATIEAATVLVIQNNRTNTTRTTTIWNLPPNSTLPPTNDAGTIVYTKTLTWNSKTITTVLAFPTGYISYDEGVRWEGTMPIARNNSHGFCSTAPENGTFTRFPSLIPPSYPTSSRTYTFTDSGGPTTMFPPNDYKTESFYLWSFVDSQNKTAAIDCEGPWSMREYDTIYTNFPPYQFCTTGMYPCAATALQSAAYLTVTSTSQEDTGPTPATQKESPKPKPSLSAPGTKHTPSPAATNTPAPAAIISTSLIPLMTSSVRTSDGDIAASLVNILASKQPAANKALPTTQDTIIPDTETDNSPSSRSTAPPNSGVDRSREPKQSSGGSSSPFQSITLPETSTPVSALSISITSVIDITALKPFTYVSGTVSTILTPTSDDKGQPVVVMSSSVTLPLVPDSDIVSSSTGVAGYIISGLGESVNSGSRTTASVGTGSSITSSINNEGSIKPDGTTFGTSATLSAQVTVSAGCHLLIDAWTFTVMALLLGILIL